ncbi:hypothetical protein WG902_09880 [Ramlibacter sp. PS3R-8]|uniref:hypothetical protein n=1 Tax=Ramlibacter sp. PS3R-8 TaxID=3133437 RepID=UPI003097FD25
MELNRNVGLSFSRNQLDWARKAAFASALLLGLLAGCGGGGETEVAQAADAAKAANAPKAAMAAQQAPDAVDGAAADPAAAAAEEDLEPAEEQERAQRAALLRAPTLAAASGRAPVGVNLEGLYDWARLQPFVDLMKTARPWGTVDAPWEERAEVDALGWPTGDAGVIVNVRTFEPGDERKAYRYLTRGVYKLKFKGRATVATTSVNVTVRGYRYDAAANRSTADVVVGAGADAIMLTFRNTRGGVKNVSLRRPGYGATETFTNEFREAMQPFGVLRLMDFLRTNDNPVRGWGERTTPASATQASRKGGAIEYAIQIANEFDKDIWINIPSGANDTYVRQLALLLRRDLAPGRVVYVEYSNELWNFIFPQATENLEAAVREAVEGDRTLTNGRLCTRELFNANVGECNKYHAGYNRIGKRVVQISDIFADVFGAAAMNNRVRVVYATQFASPGIAEQVLKNIATYRGQPSSKFYAVATAPYFYLSEQLASSEWASQEQILQSLQSSLNSENEPYFAAGALENGAFVRKAYRGGLNSGASHKALADFYGLKSIAYEGGPDLRQNPANATTKIAANRDVKMGALVRNELAQWFGCGNDLFMHFSLTSSWDRYGYWGLTNDPLEPAGPKYAAAREIALRDRATLTSCR